jgi:D-proline reductase (dithiol) PrdB
MTWRDQLMQRYYRVVGRAFSQFPELAQEWGRRFTPQSTAEANLVRLQKPLEQCRIALVTTGGVHLTDQPPFDMQDPRGDATYRVIPSDTPRERLMITHDYYDYRNAEKDMNILFPLGLLRELVAAGYIGSAGTSYGFMGHIEPPHIETLMNSTAPEVAEQMRAEQVDAVLLSPG